MIWTEQNNLLSLDLSSNFVFASIGFNLFYKIYK
jgi:hypothetical protein